MISSNVKLRVTAHSSQGGRKYMEDAFTINYQHRKDGKKLEYAFFGVYDGHGGKEAAIFAKENLMNNIVNLKYFWSNDDNLVLSAIRDGFLATHLAMWKELDNWPRTVTGLPSTAGTTASVIFIKNGKLYVGHVGDSKIVLGYGINGCDVWQSECLTKDHKPDCPDERKRIYESGGLIMNKCGVERVVWKRPKTGHQGPVRRSTDFDKIPFLAVARSLGDLWSYDYFHEEFVVSPEPDVSVIPLDLKKDQCLVLASDGLWNMLTPWDAVLLVQKIEQENAEHLKFKTFSENGSSLHNPSKILTECALERWNKFKMRADNVSVITVMLQPSKEFEISFQEVVGSNCCNQTHQTSLQCETENGNSVLNIHKISHPFPFENRVENRNTQPEIFSESSTNVAAGGAKSNKVICYPLQAQNFLPKLNTVAAAKSTHEKSARETENNMHPVPRWSRSTTGQTSLSKLAFWSKMVNKRRMSDPFPFNNNSNNILEDDTCDKKGKSREFDASIYLKTDTWLSNIKSENFCSRKLYSETLDNFSAIKQALKRKYPGIEMSPLYLYHNYSNPDIAGPWKRKPVVNKLNLTALKALNDFKHNRLRNEKH